ncbi:MAG TPA: hypothetical protein VM912_02755, partial [Terriglobales bacterium]|nr:hypothetical protein [Terriglobales bacterium]
VFNVRFNDGRVHIRMNETTGEMKDIMVEGMAVKPRHANGMRQCPAGACDLDNADLAIGVF